MVNNFGNNNKESGEHFGKIEDQLSGFDFKLSELKYRSEHDFDVILMYTHRVKERLAYEKHQGNAIACQKWGSYLKSLQSAIKVMEQVKKEL
jgi:hypothetical protein